MINKTPLTLTEKEERERRHQAQEEADKQQFDKLVQVSNLYLSFDCPYP